VATDGDLDGNSGTPAGHSSAAGTGDAGIRGRHGQTFSFKASDPNGTGYIIEDFFLINATNTITNACYGAFLPLWNALYLMNDAGTAWLEPITIGQAGTVENSQCKIDGPGTSATLGASLTLNVAVTFKPAFAGMKNTYLEVDDHGGKISVGPRAQLGTWNVAAPPSFFPACYSL